MRISDWSSDVCSSDLRLAERVDQHVEAAAVGHADDDVLDPVVAGAADHVVQQRDHRIAALERESLLADILGMQVALQALGRGQALEDAALPVAGLSEVAAGSFPAFVEPATLPRVPDVTELGADRAGIGGQLGRASLWDRWGGDV